MAEYIDREKAKRLLHIEYAYAAEQLLDEIPAAEAVSLHDIYRVIAGHSYYHGDRILAALSCIVEGKEVNPVRPADVAPVVHGVWVCVNKIDPISGYRCSKCRRRVGFDLTPYCPNCGAKMDGGDNDAAD